MAQEWRHPGRISDVLLRGHTVEVCHRCGL